MMKQAWLLKMHLKKKKDLSIANSKYTIKNKRGSTSITQSLTIMCLRATLSFLAHPISNLFK